MAQQILPFLALLQPNSRNSDAGRPAPVPKPTTPSAARQGQRLSGEFTSVVDNFQGQLLQLQAVAPVSCSEQVLVLETIGDVANFNKAVRRIPGLEWLAESEEEVEPDEDFYYHTKPAQTLDQRLFLVSTNAGALAEIHSLWQRYIEAPGQSFPVGFAPWKHLFAQLRTIRFWDVEDRIEEDIRQYWRDRILEPGARIRFEIELWFQSNEQKAAVIAMECRQLVAGLNGDVISSSRVPEIKYHALLVDLPVEVIAEVLNGRIPLLMRSPSVMFFKPSARGMSLTAPQETLLETIDRPIPQTAPVVALLDGLPLENHQLLSDRIIVDDPNGFTETYPANSRWHGSSMASLILHGDLDANGPTLRSKLYVHPILRSTEQGAEVSPEDRLLIDVVHRAVRRMFEGEGGQPATAPSVRIINLSVGDPLRLFYKRMSPWARLIDWLSFKYGVLFFISAGNVQQDVVLDLTVDQLSQTAPDEFRQLALKWLVSSAERRPLLSPAESLNALTVGAEYADSSIWAAPNGRRLLFQEPLPAPYSRCGLGYRGATKPDILLPGGRVAYQEPVIGRNPPITLRSLDQFLAVPPGLKCAAPSAGQGLNGVCWSKGTSGATALATRQAALLYERLSDIRDAVDELRQRGVEAAVLKALMVHCVSWRDMQERIMEVLPDGQHWMESKRQLSSVLGFGGFDPLRATGCTDYRATLMRGGTIASGFTHEFRVPLPPSLNGIREWRQLTITLAWLTPTDCNRQAYRSAKLSFQPPADKLHVKRKDADGHIVKKGTVQHEVLSGEAAVAFEQDDALLIKVVCQEDAGEFIDPIPYGICVSLEVAQGVGIPVYNEVRARVQAGVRA